jgi:hypothetical protein
MTVISFLVKKKKTLVKKKCETVSCCDATASCFAAKVRCEAFTYFHAVDVKRHSSMQN